jgi:carbamoyltransferase
VALNVVLNRKLMQHPWIDQLYVPPSPGDAGTALGAASWAAMELGDEVKPLRDAYLGPGYDGDSIARELEGLRIPHERLPDPAAKGASLLAAGEVVAWFQGRMEWGPRALGNRSILGHPGVPGTADDINARIKYRERWRPFCPSVLEEHAADFLGSKHPSPFMTLSFELPREWRERTPEVAHVDGTVRPQVVSRATNPRFHRLISEFERLTGLPVVINTSLNRRGEPMVCSPRDALAMFFASGLEHAILEDVYVRKGGFRE